MIVVSGQTWYIIYSVVIFTQKNNKESSRSGKNVSGRV